MPDAAARVFAVPELIEIIQLELPPSDIIKSRRTSHDFENSYQASSKIHERLMLMQNTGQDQRLSTMETNDIIFGSVIARSFSRETGPTRAWSSYNSPFSVLRGMELGINIRDGRVKVYMDEVTAELRHYWSLNDLYLVNKPHTIIISVSNGGASSRWSEATIGLTNRRLGEVLTAAYRLFRVADNTQHLRRQIQYLRQSDGNDPRCELTWNEAECSCGPEATGEECVMHWNWRKYFNGLQHVLTGERPEVDAKDIWSYQ